MDKMESVGSQSGRPEAQEAHSKPMKLIAAFAPCKRCICLMHRTKDPGPGRDRGFW